MPRGGTRVETHRLAPEGPIDGLTLLLPGLLGGMVGAGGFRELAEAGRPKEPAVLTQRDWREPRGARMPRR